MPRPKGYVLSPEQREHLSLSLKRMWRGLRRGSLFVDGSEHMRCPNCDHVFPISGEHVAPQPPPRPNDEIVEPVTPIVKRRATDDLASPTSVVFKHDSQNRSSHEIDLPIDPANLISWEEQLVFTRAQVMEAAGYGKREGAPGYVAPAPILDTPPESTATPETVTPPRKRFMIRRIR